MTNTVVPAESVSNKLKHARLIAVVRHAIYDRMESVKESITFSQPVRSYKSIHHRSQAKKRRHNRR